MTTDTDTKEASLWLVPIGLLLVSPWALAAIAWGGFVIHMTWNWFLVPLGLPAIGFVLACGIEVFQQNFRSSAFGYQMKQATWREKFVERPFLTPAILLFFGWLVHLAQGWLQ